MPKHPHRWEPRSDGYPNRNLPKLCLRCGVTLNYVYGPGGKTIAANPAFYGSVTEYQFPDGRTVRSTSNGQAVPCPGKTTTTTTTEPAMPSKSSLVVLLDPAWPALGTDSVAVNARKALIEAGITPDAASKMPRHELQAVRGLGVTRFDHVQAYLLRLADARVADAAAVAREAAKGKPGHCADCGDRRATDPRNVVADLRGQLRHVGPPGGPLLPWCQPCHDHHRAVLGMLVNA